MKEIQEEELKTLELDILKYIRQCFDQNGLRYYLAYGTLIGAVRHQGFIPWDDDVDIIMPRADYFQLMEYIRQDDSHYAFLSMHNVPDFPFPLAKVVDTRTKLVQHGVVGSHELLGAYVDIFILEHLPDDPQQVQVYAKQLKRKQNIWYLAQRKLVLRKKSLVKDLLLAAASLPCKLIGARRAALGLDRLAAKYQHTPAENQAVLMLVNNVASGTLSTEEWNAVTDVPFEGEQFSAMENYGKFLTQIYGDYMQPPPSESQVSIHSFDVYWKTCEGGSNITSCIAE